MNKMMDFPCVKKQQILTCTLLKKKNGTMAVPILPLAITLKILPSGTICGIVQWQHGSPLVPSCFPHLLPACYQVHGLQSYPACKSPFQEWMCFKSSPSNLDID